MKFIARLYFFVIVDSHIYLCSEKQDHYVFSRKILVVHMYIFVEHTEGLYGASVAALLREPHHSNLVLASCIGPLFLVV